MMAVVMTRSVVVMAAMTIVGRKGGMPTGGTKERRYRGCGVGGGENSSMCMYWEEWKVGGGAWVGVGGRGKGMCARAAAFLPRARSDSIIDQALMQMKRR